jgi:hypothetical protein
VDEIAGRVRLSLDGLVSADGMTLQEASDELVWKMLVTVMVLRSRGVGAVCRADVQLVRFLWELCEIGAAGGDFRERLFGSSAVPA